MDALAKGKNYRLQVSAVELTDAEEKAANIALNNQEMAGSFDSEALAAMLKDADVDRQAAGIDESMMFQILGEESPPDVLGEMAERIEAARKIAEATRKSAIDKYETDYYLVLVWRDHAARKLVTDAMGLEDNRYVDGAAFVRAVHELDALPDGDESDEPLPPLEAPRDQPIA